MRHAVKSLGFLSTVAVMVTVAGCRTTRGDGDTAGRFATRRSRQHPVRRVVCLYDQRPWLNLDAAGDRDPEGIRYRVYLDVGKEKAELRDGTFRIVMYRIDRKSLDEIERTLVSDWEYPTDTFQRIESELLGMGYHLRLRWAGKDIAGKEVEIITQHKDVDGTTVRSGTKRFRVPEYKF